MKTATIVNHLISAHQDPWISNRALIIWLVFNCVFKLLVEEDEWSLWLHFSHLYVFKCWLNFFMSIFYYKVKLFSLVYLFSTVPLQMCPQLVYICFASLCFQMFPQITCRRGCKIAPVALSWFFSVVCFRNVLKWCAMQIMIHFFGFVPLCFATCLFNVAGWEDV